MNSSICVDGEIRLADGQNVYEGRIEMCLNSQWGTICDDNWSSMDAKVACRQLGYGTEGLYDL